jgi:hypothetical protein
MRPESVSCQHAAASLGDHLGTIYDPLVAIGARRRSRAGASLESFRCVSFAFERPRIPRGGPRPRSRTLSGGRERTSKVAARDGSGVTASESQVRWALGRGQKTNSCPIDRTMFEPAIAAGCRGEADNPMGAAPSGISTGRPSSPSNSVVDAPTATGGSNSTTPTDVACAGRRPQPMEAGATVGAFSTPIATWPFTVRAGGQSQASRTAPRPRVVAIG